MVAAAFNPSTGRGALAEADVSEFQTQPGLHNDTLSRKEEGREEKKLEI